MLYGQHNSFFFLRNQSTHHLVEADEIYFVVTNMLYSEIPVGEERRPGRERDWCGGA